MYFDHLLPEIFAHVNSSSTQEVGGLICDNQGEIIFVPCRNLSTATHEFILHPEDHVAAEDAYTIMAFVHSHLYESANPSPGDLVEIERSQLPYLIVNFPNNQWTYTEPSGYEAPYVGRPFVHGTLDCYELVRDYYRRELGINLAAVPRDSDWWNKGENILEEVYEMLGFVQVESPTEHDLVIMQVKSPVPNHAAVFLANGQVLHHVGGRPSGHDVYDGYWRKCTIKFLRHQSRC
jgi:proteasome lid subunit RPN8/RPN11